MSCLCHAFRTCVRYPIATRERRPAQLDGIHSDASLHERAMSHGKALRRCIHTDLRVSWVRTRRTGTVFHICGKDCGKTGNGLVGYFQVPPLRVSLSTWRRPPPAHH